MSTSPTTTAPGADWDDAYEAPNTLTTHSPGPLPAPPAPTPGDRVEPAPHTQPAGAIETTATEAEQEPMFPTLEEWVTDYLAPIITLELGPGMRWCAQWWRHALAISILESLWRAWEDHRISDNPSAMSEWWLDHAKPHMDFLMEGSWSPFRQCAAEPGGRGHSDELQPLPVEPAPPGWFG